MTGFNFSANVLERLAADRPDDEALRALDVNGSVTSMTFLDVAEQTELASAGLAAAGVGAGDVVMTMIGARIEWVISMLAVWRLGAVALPGSEQLRAHDIAHRIDAADVSLILSADRDWEQVESALDLAEGAPQVFDIDDESLPAGVPAPARATTPDDPALIVFTSGTSGEPRGAVHTQGYLAGQRVQAEHWYDARPGELAWCTAASGWSLSARNAFVAPWLNGAAAFLHEGRFDPGERLELIASEGVAVLCQAPTEYRMIAKRASLDGFSAPALRRMVSAGEPLNPEIMATFKQATGLDIYDGYGQTETGPLVGMPLDRPVRPGSMGKPMPGYAIDLRDEQDACTDHGELCVDPATVPTFFRGYLGEPPQSRDLWRTGDRVRRDEDGYLWFDGRIDDVIISAGYRIGPFEVESALVEHPAVAEAAAVAAPDDERGSVVRAVVVLRDGYEASDDTADQLKRHVRDATAPYKYPRIVEFTDALPKTASGKIKRAVLRADQP